MFKKKRLPLTRREKLSNTLLVLVAIMVAMAIWLADLSANYVALKIYPTPKLPRIKIIEKAPSIYQQISDITGGENVDVLYNLAKCESGLRVYAVGVNYDRFNSYDRGFYQINSHWHSEVNDNCSFDLTCSTLWTNNMIKKGNLSEWSCADKI